MLIIAFLKTWKILFFLFFPHSTNSAPSPMKLQLPTLITET
jgi:hypothetical protein